MYQKSHTGGILTIVSGVLGILECAVLVIVIACVRLVETSPEFGVNYADPDVFQFIYLIYGLPALLCLLLGVLGIIGGIYAAKRRLWGLALAGAIGSVITFLPLGIAAVIMIAQAQKEFSSPPSDNVEILPDTVTEQL